MDEALLNNPEKNKNNGKKTLGDTYTSYSYL